jgi:deferrochelatase/peroxidase EfeB
MAESNDNKVSRRRFLGTAVGLGAAAVVGSSVNFAHATTEEKPGELSTEKIAFRGIHQAGITNAAPAAAIIAAFDITAPDRTGVREMLQTLTSEAENLTQAHSIDELGEAYPPHDNLIIGSDPAADGLTITAAVGASFFDDRFGLKSQKPKELIAMPHYPNDEIDPERVHGDFLLQICAHHPETCFRALRILMKATRNSLVLRWMEQGFQQPNTMKAGETSTRNLLGFKDGTANPKTSDDSLMDDIVWVTNKDDEPDWAVGGSYMVTRLIRMRVEQWDRTSLVEQENILGRNKKTGAPLGMKHERDIPAFHERPIHGQIPVNAHIRLANPRTKQTQKNRILRRGFNFSRGFDANGHLDQGLLFVCFQKSVNDGFITVQERLNGEPLEEYIVPNGGGFFFALPGVQEGQFLGQALVG